MSNTCPLHQVSFTKYEKEGKTWYAHRDGIVWCNQAKLPKTDQQSLPEAPKTASPNSSGPTPNWENIKQKEQDGMYKMAALKAASGIIAAEIARPDFELPADLFQHTENFTNKILKWLKEEV